MFKTDLLDWPRLVTHLSPGSMIYRSTCFVCGHVWAEVERPGTVKTVECPMCSCGIHTTFPMPEQARGHDGVWIDPGTEPSTLYLN